MFCKTWWLNRLENVDENIINDYYNLIYNGLDETDNISHKILRIYDKNMRQTKK